MKKLREFGRRALAIVAAIVMVLALLPSSALEASAASTSGVTKTAYSAFYPNSNTYNVVSGNWAETGRGTVVLNENTTTAVDQAFTWYYGNHYLGYAQGFYNLAVESNSNSNVATAAVTQGTTSDGYPCMEVTFTRGSESGTTRIVIGFTVTQLHVTAGIATDSDTSSAVSGQLIYTVSNGGDIVVGDNGDVQQHNNNDTNITIDLDTQTEPKFWGFWISSSLNGRKVYPTAIPSITLDVEDESIVDVTSEVIQNGSMMGPAYYFTGLKAGTTTVTAVATYTINNIAGNTYTSTINVTVTSSKKEVQLTYIDGEASAKQTVTAGSEVTVLGALTSKEGYTFKGWAESADATEAQYEADSKLTVNESKTLYAVWEKVEEQEPTQPESKDPSEGGDNGEGSEGGDNGDGSGSGSGSGSATTKTNKPALEKKVEGETEVAVTAGSTLNFTLTSNVPDYLGDYLLPDDVDAPTVDGRDTAGSAAATKDDLGNRGSYVLTFHDTMAEGLTLNNDLTVKVNGTALDSKLYTLTTEGLTDDCTFEVTMDLVKIYEAGSYFGFDDIENAPSIVVSYTGTLATDATAGTYTNSSHVSYEGTVSETDVVKVDTFGIKIFKYDQADSSKGLAGATFTLTDANGKEVTATSDADGNLSFEGLTTGTYKLTETKAPEGYVKSSEEVTIYIAPGEDNNDADATNYVNVKFANALIPHTGGSGTFVYTVVGAVILGLAVVVFLVSRRKEEE
jgi:fimbrial isopeptide formation D2 family protein/LPXTG-motif cell wall-anchored protein/uncharacterized repeat protein (TIGR02543 family)